MVRLGLLKFITAVSKSCNTIDFVPGKGTKIAFTHYPYGRKALKGGDSTVEAALKTIFEQNGFQTMNLEYSPKRIPGGKLLQCVFGIPFVYSRIIEKASPNYALILAGSEVLWRTKANNVVAIFHISYADFLQQVVRKSSPLNVMLWRYRAYAQKIGTQHSYNVSVSSQLAKKLEAIGITVHNVIPNAVDTELFRPQHQGNRQGLCFAGSFSWYAKGFDVLEGIAAKIGQPVICYTNGEKHCSLLQFRPPVSHEEMAKVLNEHRILVFPSRYESFGLVPVEAMACGVPVVMHKVGIAEHIESLEPAFVVNSLNVKDFCQQIERIESNYAYYSYKARQIAVEYFDQKRYREKWLALLNTLLNEKSEEVGEKAKAD